MAIVNAKNVQGLFEIGEKIDMVCENCHLEFWYPNEKAAAAAKDLERRSLPAPNDPLAIRPARRSDASGARRPLLRRHGPRALRLKPRQRAAPLSGTSG